MKYSIVLVNYSKLEQSLYGIYSWMLQKCDFDYEIVLVHCVDYMDQLEEFIKNKVPNCKFINKKIDKPIQFNLAAFRNLGAFYTSGERLIFASVDIVRKSNFLNNIDKKTNHNCWISIGSYHVLYHRNFFRKFKSYLDIKKYSLDDVIDKIGIKFEHKHSIDYGTAIVNKEDFINIGGYNSELWFHEDAELDFRANEYFKLKGEEHPIIRETDTTLFPGAKLKGRKNDDMRSHGMEVNHTDKINSREYLGKLTADKVVFPEFIMNEEYLLNKVFKD